MIASVAFPILPTTMKSISHTLGVCFFFFVRPQRGNNTIFIVVDLALNRIPNDVRPAVVDIINQSKSSPSQKRALLLKKGLLRSTADELEVLAEVGELQIVSVRSLI